MYGEVAVINDIFPDNATPLRMQKYLERFGEVCYDDDGCGVSESLHNRLRGDIAEEERPYNATELAETATRMENIVVEVFLQRRVGRNKRVRRSML